MWLKREGENIANYLLSHYKGIYRIKCEYDARLNAFPRKLDGTYEDIDCYIVCANNIRIFSVERGILQAYIPSIGRGRNIVKAIKEEFQGEIIFDAEQTDAEILFKFSTKDADKIIPLLKPKTSGANISPFSSRNLPKNKSYKIPDEELSSYKSIVENIPKERILSITHTTNDFLKSLVTKKNTWEDIKADMALKGLKGKEYIHLIGKWNDYIKYMEKNIKE